VTLMATLTLTLPANAHGAAPGPAGVTPATSEDSGC
jgi:hypothetical protein